MRARGYLDGGGLVTETPIFEQCVDEHGIWPCPPLSGFSTKAMRGVPYIDGPQRWHLPIALPDDEHEPPLHEEDA